MSQTWDTGSMSKALGDTTNDDRETSAPPNPDPQALGWVKPEKYEYPDADNKDNNAAGNAESGWAHSFKKYEWKDEFGDVGPEIPELEKDLFHNEFTSRRGIKFDDVLAVNVITEATVKPNPIDSFATAGLHPVMASNIEKCGYEVPTPIQAYTIPAVIQGKDVIATAQTGSGKTAAFLIPSISQLMGKVKKIAAPRPGPSADGYHQRVRAEPLILIIAPTRELCCQIFDEARRLCYRSMLRPCVVYGGAPPREQKDELRKGCDVLIATPGRFLDFLNDTQLLSLCRLRFTIIDEADEMLHDDWEDEMTKIMSGADANEDDNHQYLLFSATFNKDMRKLAKKYLNENHVRIRIGRSGAVKADVVQKIVFVERNSKQQALYDLLISTPPARTMVFVKSKKTADFVDDYLFNQGLPSTSIHSDRTQREREDAIRAFRIGSAPILVTTGVAARGIDVRNIMHVINFDLPEVEFGGEDEYIHRIGRTARIGNQGLATSFYNDHDEPLAQFLVNTLIECKQEIPEFLSHLKPGDGAAIDWNDDSGAEDEQEDQSGAEVGGSWGAGGGENNNQAWGAGDTVAHVVGNTAAPEVVWGTDDTGSGAAW